MTILFDVISIDYIIVVLSYVVLDMGRSPNHRCRIGLYRIGPVNGRQFRPVNRSVAPNWAKEKHERDGDQSVDPVFCTCFIVSVHGILCFRFQKKKGKHLNTRARESAHVGGA